MKNVNHAVIIQNKRHTYSLSQKKGGVVRIVCKSANINQDFLAGDVPALLINLPNLIGAKKMTTTFSKLKKKALKNPEVRREYDRLLPEFKKKIGKKVK